MLMIYQHDLKSNHIKMKNQRLILLTTFLLYSACYSLAQSIPKTLEELQATLRNTGEHDTIKVETYIKIGAHYFKSQYDSALFFTTKALDLSQKISFQRGIL